MSTFADDEESTEGSMPREAIEIVLPSITYRLATGDQPITIGGNVYSPFAAQRGEIVVDVAGGSTSPLTITLPVSHPAVQRYLRNCVPPRQITVNVYRLQLTSGASIQMWSGPWDSVSVKRHLATISVPNSMSYALRRKLPTITLGRECSNDLYDAKCRVVRASFTVSTTVSTFAGGVVTVASMSGKPDQWAQFGELLHVPSGERMPISSQVGTTIQMQFPIAELQDGDAVQVFAGCAHDVFTCRDKFNSVVNYIGAPQLPTSNPFTPNGFGVVQQT